MHSILQLFRRKSLTCGKSVHDAMKNLHCHKKESCLPVFQGRIGQDPCGDQASQVFGQCGDIFQAKPPVLHLRSLYSAKGIEASRTSLTRYVVLTYV
jgi:hypothetical protein